jgi:hypothetical protein
LADDSAPAPTLFAANLPDAATAVRFSSAGASGADPSPKQALTASAPEESSSSSLSPASLHAALEKSSSLSAIRVADSSPTPSRFISPISRPSRRTWIALAIAQHAAASFDAATTRNAISSGAVERDPLLRPFAASPAVYAAIQVGPLALDYASRRMQRSENSLARRAWWVPQSVATGMFLFSGVHNIHVAARN